MVQQKQEFICDICKEKVDKVNFYESFCIPVIRTHNNTNDCEEKEYYSMAILDVCKNCMKKIVKVKCDSQKDIELINDLKIGYKDDKIFLLSVEEYKKYKDIINIIPVFWWLRSPSKVSDGVVGVYGDGSVGDYGVRVDYDTNAIRPALKYNSTEDIIYCYGATWDKIDDNLYISHMPIEFMRFDEKFNDYETSEIRKFLLDFIK